MTRAADNEAFVRAFQRLHGLKEDGWAGAATNAALTRPANVSENGAVFNAAITPRVALELLKHEAIVLEAYKDSVGVWTWGVGVTNASGHNVDRYKDKPQTVERVLEVYAWLLAEKYAPAVRQAFSDRKLTEAQFGAALSFHYNTGAIGRASWVKTWLAGDVAKARDQFLEWRRPPAIMDRRRAEADLFFDGKWTNDGNVMIYPVLKPSYQPNFGKGQRVNIRDAVERALS